MLPIDSVVKINLTVGAPSSAAVVFDVGLILGSSNVVSVADRVKAYASLDAVVSGGFAATTDEYKAAAAYFAADPAPTSVLIGRIDENETPVAALQAVLNKDVLFDGIYVCGATVPQLEALVEYVDAQKHYHVYAAVTGTVAAAAAADGLLAKMQEAGTRRFAGIYSASDAFKGAALMGCVCGMFHAYTDTAVQICYCSLGDAATDTLTETEIASIKALGGNVYVSRRRSRGLVEPGTTAGGIRIDDSIYLDMMSAQMQDACFALTIDQATRLPQNDSTSAQYINVISNVLNSFVDMNVVGPGQWEGNKVGELETGDTLERGYYLFAESYNRQTAEDRQQHKAMPINCALILVGSVESVEINVNVQR